MLTAYLTALDPRIAVAAICCYITTLPRRMGNRIEADPDSDPEQDIFGFVGEGIDHAGLLALCAPRPVLLGTARFDFFPIEGARESFDEAKHLYQAADAGDRIERAEAAEKHGLTLPLRKAVYRWFDLWLAKRKGETPDEFAVKPRPAKELLVCAEGQVNRTFQSRPLLPLALEEFRKKKTSPRISLNDLLRLDAETADFAIDMIHDLTKKEQTLIVCINGNETRNWQEEKEFLEALGKTGFELKEKPAYKALAAGDIAALADDHLKLLMQLVLDTHAGMTTDEFNKAVGDWIATAKHPRFNRLYSECTYQPMQEVLKHLRANGYKTFIVSGGGQDFMRVWAQKVYPPGGGSSSDSFAVR